MTVNIVDFETDKLPVCIFANDELKSWFANINQVMARLEAEVNFQTMLAGWYGDEDKLPAIEIAFTSATGFESFLSEQSTMVVNQLADDVFYRFNPDKKQATGFVCFTESELSLIEKHAKLLPGIAKAKLVKLIFAIAESLELPAVPTLK